MWAYLGMFVAGAAVGIRIWVTYFDNTPEPSQYTYYRGGYQDGHSDGTDGIWRGGPLR